MRNAAPKINAPFGRIYQREWDYLARANVPALSRHIYATLVVRAGASRAVPDGIASLVKWSGLKDRKVRACLRDLQKRGLIRRERSPRREGRGSFTSRTELVPFDKWPRVLDQAAPNAEWSAPTNRHESHDQPAQIDGPTGTATRNNQDVTPYLEKNQESVLKRYDEEERRRNARVADELCAVASPRREERGRPLRMMAFRDYAETLIARRSAAEQATETAAE